MATVLAAAGPDAPSVRATALGLTRAPSLVDEPTADLYLATVERQGRLGLLQPARHMRWLPRSVVTFSVVDEVVRLTARTRRTPGVDVSFDHRCRVLVPYGVRSLVGLHPGVRVLVVAMPDEAALALLAVDRVIASFAGRR